MRNIFFLKKKRWGQGKCFCPVYSKGYMQQWSVYNLKLHSIVPKLLTARFVILRRWFLSDSTLEKAYLCPLQLLFERKVWVHVGEHILISRMRPKTVLKNRIILKLCRIPTYGTQVNEKEFRKLLLFWKVREDLNEAVVPFYFFFFPRGKVGSGGRNKMPSLRQTSLSTSWA